MISFYNYYFSFAFFKRPILLIFHEHYMFLKILNRLKIFVFYKENYFYRFQFYCLVRLKLFRRREAKALQNLWLAVSLRETPSLLYFFLSISTIYLSSLWGNIFNSTPTTRSSFTLSLTMMNFNVIWKRIC
jgi:hypothetical protein